MNTTTVPDRTEVSELRICIDNDADIYNKAIVPIVKSMKKRLNAGTYDKDLGVRPFEKVAEIGAKLYTEKYCGRGDKWYEIFSVAVRKAVAQEMQEYHLTEIGLGNYL